MLVTDKVMSAAMPASAHEAPAATAMTTAPDVAMVVQAVATLYHNPDPKAKEAANNWLQSWQRSVFAWKVRSN